MSFKKEVTPEIMQECAKLLKSIMPDGYGFTLILFETNQQPTKMHYISDAERNDMKVSLKELLNKWEAIDRIKGGLNSN